MGVCRYWYNFFLPLVNGYKSIEISESGPLIELDDIHKCVRENVSTNNMDGIGWDDMELCIHLEKATREGRILFTLERSLESKYVKLYIHTSIPFLFLLF